MMKNLLGRGRIVGEVIEEDIEKAEQSNKLEITEEDVEKADSSTKPKEPEQDIDKAESTSLNSCYLKKLAFKFFNLSMPSEDESRNSEAEHLLDLIRKKFIPIPSSNGSSRNATNESPSPDKYSKLILSAKTLRLQGIKFKGPRDHSALKVLYKKMIDFLFKEPTPRNAQEKTILEIKLDRNELHIPPLVVDAFISSVLLNCVAFEQLSANCSSDITSYVVFMGCLVKDDKADAIYLCEKGIIENYIGNASDVSKFFKNICNGIAFDMKKSYLKEEFEGINKYTSIKWNVECARFMHLHAVLKFLRSQQVRPCSFPYLDKISKRSI